MFKDHFSGHAGGYAAHRPVYPRELIDYLADTCRRRDLTWDCGCGSGQLSIPLTQRFAQVAATDASRSQLAHAAVHPRVHYWCALAESSGLNSGSVDLIVAAQAAHWFDLPAFYDEVRRVARPAGIVALVTYGLQNITPEIDRIVETFYRDVVGAYWPPERLHVEDGYRSLLFPFEELPAPSLHCEAHWGCAAFMGYVGTWSATQAFLKAHGHHAVAQFEAELVQSWGLPGLVRQVRWPLSLRIGRIAIE